MPMLQPVAADGRTLSFASPPSPSLLRGQEEARALVAKLKERIARIDGTAHRLPPSRMVRDVPRWRLGVEAVDRHLPDEGLMRYGLHDVAPESYGDTSAAMGFVLALAIKRLTLAGEWRPLLWCRLRREAREHGALYGHGAEALGLSRQRLLTVTLPKPASVFWTLEEALKSGALAVVIGDADESKTDLTVTRRLSLAAHAGKAAGLLLFTRQHTNTTASMSRWLVKSMPSLEGPQAAGVGPPAWDVSLTRIRGGKPGHWTLSWHPQEHAPHYFTLVSSFPRGTVHPYTAEDAQTCAATVTALRAG